MDGQAPGAAGPGYVEDGRAYLRSVLDAAVYPVAIIDRDGAIAEFSAGAARATGRSRSTAAGTALADCFTDPGKASAACARAFRDGAVRNIVLELANADGSRLPVLFNASEVRDPSGRMAEVLCEMRDIASVRESAAILRDSTERLRVIFENAPIGIDELTPDGHIVRVNQHFCDIVGYQSAELAGRPIGDLTHPGDRAADEAHTRQLLAGEIPSYSIEKRFVTKGGAVVWANVSRALVADQEGTPMAIIGAVRDVTAQRRAEAQVRALNADLEARIERRTAELGQANKDLEAFTYSVSHDLRAPLRAMSGFSEALLEEYGPALDPTAAGYAERIAAAAERMGSLIDDLLVLSRVTRAELSIGPVDLSAEVAAITADLRRQDPDRAARFDIEERIVADADRALIRTVLQNLLENAWKFTSRCPEAVIEFGRGPADPGQVGCLVRDNGAGFDQAYAGQLFQPFQRLHTAAEFPGSGIGLASVQRIVTRHGGRIWAEGAVNQGATFYFTLADAGHAAQRSAPGPPLSASSRRTAPGSATGQAQARR